MAGKRRNGRGIDAEERALWQKVVEKADPLHKAARPPTINSMRKAVSSASPRIPARAVLPPRPERFAIGEKAAKHATVNRLQPGLEEQFANVASNMDKRNFDRLKKGKKPVDGRIDLHGMTLAEAHPALIGFVFEAHNAGKRLLLVITGKGKQRRDDWVMPERLGVLKHQVPQWLAMPPLSPLVLQVTQATQKHGGGGAYYVYLRRRR